MDFSTAVQFRAGLHGRAYDDITLARQEAEGMANGLQEDVQLYLLSNERAVPFIVVYYKKG